MRFAALMLAGSLLPGCTDAGGDAVTNANSSEENSAAADAERDSGWDLQSDGDGVTLVLGPGADPAIRLVCPAREKQLLVNVPSLQPIGSEERLSFGGGGEVVALVADTSGDAVRGGVSGTGAVPDDLAALLSGPVSVSYGAQTSGPHQAPPGQLANAFVAACSGEVLPGQPVPKDANVSACLIQDGERIAENRLKAVGTEPFWAAEIHGRCVTYSTPENQSGTRIWAEFNGSRDSGVWTGYYQDQRFVLRTRPSPGCSDGMSDKSYPVGVTLVVGGEERMGCAEYP